MEENANILEKENTPPNTKDINTWHHVQKLLFTRMCGVISCHKCEKKYLKMWLNIVSKILPQALNDYQFSFMQPTGTIVWTKKIFIAEEEVIKYKRGIMSKSHLCFWKSSSYGWKTFKNGT
jgi:hypothetical protein